MSQTTRFMPLSYAFKRMGDEAEFNELAKLVKEKVQGRKKPYSYMLDALLMGLIAYIFVVIATYGVAFIAQAITNTPLLQQIPFAYGTYFFFMGFSVYGSFKAFKAMKALEKLYYGAESDFDTHQVQEEAWRFVNAASFHSPETKDYFLLLHSDTDETLLFHGDKLTHDKIMLYAPADMVLVRSINTGLVLKCMTSGPTLTLHDHYVSKFIASEFPAHGLNVTQELGLNFKEAIAFYS